MDYVCGQSDMYKPDITCSISRISMPGCIMNASGALCRTFDELTNLNNSESCAVVSKSCTMDFRKGNPYPRWFTGDGFSINSMGLPNSGYKEYNIIADNISKKKPYIMSVAGMSMNEGLEILQNIEMKENMMIEINMSCPNLPGKPQIGYDFQMVDDYLEKIQDILNSKKSFAAVIIWGIKLPPYFDQVHFEQMSNIIKKYDLHFVTCINSIGNGLVVNTEKEMTVIHPKDGLGGIGGRYIKPTALANVHLFRKLLPERIHVIGCGGVESGEDVFQHILVGATCVQVGTTLVNEGVCCFDRINRELIKLMKDKNYKKLSDFRNKLRLVKRQPDTFLGCSVPPDLD